LASSVLNAQRKFEDAAMKRFRNFRLLVLAGAALLAAGGARPARAQDPDDQTRGVARISLMDGEVSVKRGDTSDWVAGVINAPLLSTDRISTSPNSRAEVQFDSANLMRLGGNAEANLATIEYGRYQVELAHGTLTYVVLRASSANVEVDTPSVSVRPSKQGVYRVSVNDAGETQVIVRAGDVEVFTPRGSQWVNGGQMLVARGAASDPEFQIVAAPGLDDWDRWNQSRDQAMVRSASYQNVPQGVYGAEDLDAAGTWNNVAGYGNVWTPVGMGPGWAPYRNGRWVWEDWYGWTWVSYDPWGWAPYHYGRWFFDAGFGWCWYPGVFGHRHYWSPALVGWFGYGGGVGFGFGFGNVGWVPLAPYELFHPWWGRGFYGRGFNERVNITNVNVTNVYRNARFNGVSGMSANDFHSGRFNTIGRVSGDQIRSAGLVRGQMPIAPTASHLQFANRGAGFVPRSTGNQHFFTHQAPAAAQRTPFAQQQRSIEQQPGRTFGSQARGGVSAAPGAPAVRAAETGRGSLQGQQPAAQPGGLSRTAQTGGGWPRFGQPGEQGAAPATRPSQALENTRPPSASGGQTSGGWSRFGEPRSSGGAGAQAAPRSNPQGGSGFGSPRNSAPAPSYSAPRSSGPSPSYSAPRSAPAPSYSGPRGGGGGGSYSAPRGGGGGGSAPRGGGGGGGHASGGGGGHGRK
jgi:FecR protein